MRLHRLEVTAFGPFAGTVEVDLDRLSEGGLFLLTGATGAGKTSILDAVCFALYGDVPGDRGKAKSLRSDHAAPGVPPRVELELSVGGRRLRLVRSPSWERPKKKGTGWTTEQASVVVSERSGPPEQPEWRTLSTRLDETGQLVSDLLGMTRTQFTQVAMLPQGQFQAFLRARSEERHALLQQLFRTGRFEDVEAWLKERRRALRQESAQVEERLADLASRVSETAGLPAPDPQGWAEGLLPWAAAARTDVAAALSSTTEQVASAAHEEEQSRERLAEARAADERRRRRAAAAAEHARLQERAEEHAREVAALDAARRASPVGVAAARRDQARHEVDRLARRATALLDGPLAPLPSLHGLAVPDADRPPDATAVLARLEDALGEALGSVRASLPRLVLLQRTEARLPQLGAACAAAEERLADCESTGAVLPGRIVAARDELTALRTTASTLPVHETARAALVERRDAALEVLRVERDLEVARLAHLEARERAASSHEQLLTVREARIESMAAELAGALAVGACCPVCGSAEHPAKAEAAPGDPDAAGEREAQRRLDDDKAAEHLRAMDVRDLEVRRILLLERADGLDPAAAAEELLTLDALVAEATHARDALPAAAEALERLEQQLAAHGQALEHARLALAEAREQHRAAVGEVERAESDLREAALVALRALAADGSVPEGAEPEAGREADPTDDDPHADEPDLLDLLLAVETQTGSVGTAQDSDREASYAEGRPDLAALEAALAERQRAVRDLSAVLVARAAADRALTEAEAHVQDVLARADIATVEDALAAALPEPDLARLEESAQHHRTRVAAVTEVLAGDDRGDQQPGDPDQEAPADLPALERAHAEALAGLGRTRAAAAGLTERCGRLTALLVDLERTLAAWQPVREQLALVSQLAAFVEGRSADNSLQMRLSAYVLAWRLSQVVAAANERLAGMTDRRYALEHTGRRGAGETRGGLSLRVRDDWSGESRDPVTLSGGETFVVSLALALGLADVISQEAGGAELDTLFVDEGFGSLDADTLEDVMDTLDSLREGGRVVGVVSHVADMRDRIPVQLHVAKGRSGSTVVLRHGT
ncbi:SMC family ATPase [Nocardioides sp.]|uniref:AAA family ATPase n=1 Tax=Nocardioides sp. TaxID=35761 RepID=UPI002609786F|nr:SMC family ATPase [Nocardioides sp.]